MNTGELLEALRKKAAENEGLRQKLIETRNTRTPLSEFCKIAREEGLPLFEMDILEFGEASYAAMRRSTNGGGENAPLLRWEDDAYEMFLMELEMI